MVYIIKCISGIHSRDDFQIKSGQELEVSKEIYDYFNNNRGGSGHFNFITRGTDKKVSRPTPEPEEVKEQEDKKEVKVTKKSVKKDS